MARYTTNITFKNDRGAKMKKTEMTNYMRLEMWVERVNETISNWGNIQGIIVPEDIKESIIKFIRPKIKKGIKKGTLTRMFMQIAITALLYIKIKKDDQ